MYLLSFHLIFLKFQNIHRACDQIVRTDLHALYHMNLQMKALAYTPFCDSRSETDGFRCGTSSCGGFELGFGLGCYCG